MSIYLSICIVGIINFTSLWVYIDASKNKIGKIPTNKIEFANMSAFFWGICTYGLWIVAFPVYLIKRKKLIEKAHIYPVQSKFRKLIITIFSIIFIITFLNAIYKGYLFHKSTQILTTYIDQTFHPLKKDLPEKVATSIKVKNIYIEQNFLYSVFHVGSNGLTYFIELATPDI